MDAKAAPIKLAKVSVIFSKYVKYWTGLVKLIVKLHFKPNHVVNRYFKGSI